VGETLGQRPVADGERFLPDVIAGDVTEAVPLVQADDVAGEVHEVVVPGVAGGHVHAVHGRHPPGHREAGEFADDEGVLLEELRVIAAVR
jgi:hypothetical protein